MQMKTSHLVKDERGDGIFAVSCLLIDFLIVSTCVYIKQVYLKINQKESGVRRPLNCSTLTQGWLKLL